jgi:uncharacterized membrane protein
MTVSPFLFLLFNLCFLALACLRCSSILFRPQSLSYVSSQIEIKGFGIEKMAVHVNFSAASTFSSAKLVSFQKHVSDE